MTDLVPPPPPVGFTYDGSPDALAKIEHLFGRKRMRMIERVETRTQLNMRTMQRETASIPRPDPYTLEIAVDADHGKVVDGGHWVYIPIGARIEHAWNSDVTLVISLGPPERPISWGELPDGTPYVEEHG